MIAASHLDLEHNVAKELPQYVDSLIFEVKGQGTFSVEFQHSADGTNWYTIGSALTSNSITVSPATGTVDLTKVHFRRHKR